MIESSSMFASSSFSDGEMTSEFLVGMDNSEKSIVEKEEKEISEHREHEKNKIGLITSVTSAVISVFILTSSPKMNIHNLSNSQLAKDIILPSLGFTLGGYGIGRLIGSTNRDFEKKISLNRNIRLQKKVLAIDLKTASISKDSLDLSEIKQLQEAKIFFSAKVMDYQSTRNAEGHGTSILYQNNVYSKA